MTTETLLQSMVETFYRLAHRQAIQGINPFNRLEFPGGLSGLAQALGVPTSDGDVGPSLSKALLIGQNRRGDLGKPWLWMAYVPQRKSASVVIVVGPAIAPGYAETFKAAPHSLPLVDVAALTQTVLLANNT